ncbi:L-seryl-tRNA(Sec) kinase [Takifugu flavidus]|uniref:L-seryl-tRNA(Sec) kinase n=1 Tax=Takifugu flavidus TaxID=433684 RepID=A0A5C6PTY2_9TELE|nr:L-seryl-tRNA(Sec) kinase [Takifugu flavidus]TWW81970.1 L-seryl-tRNA(Sec) kinase [Takifugu flavidus]
MASGEVGGQCRAPACLCVLCGLPAAGKSTLAGEVLRTAALAGWRSAVIPYDDLIPDHAFQAKEMDGVVKLQESHSEWKSHRQAVLQCIGNFLDETVLVQMPNSCQINRAAWEQCIQTLPQRGVSDASHKPLIFLMDDNFYYSSMRYEVHQLARKYSLGFCQVYLHCDLELCISRNEKRSQPVQAKVIREMEMRLEPPNPEKNVWEKNSISLTSMDVFSKSDIQRVMELISTALCNPLSPVEDNTVQSEADRLKCATNMLHQADQTCRRLISEAMKTAGENGVSSGQMRTLSAQLSESKATFLRDLRRVFQEAPVPQEDDMDVEGMVKRAVNVFDHRRKEILLEIMNDNK